MDTQDQAIVVQGQAKPVALRFKIVNTLRIIVGSIVRLFCSFYYANEAKKIPPIKNEILKIPAVQIAKQIRNKEVTSVEVLEAFICRIKDMNSVLNCFVEDRFEQALKEAREADELIRSNTLTNEQLEKEKPLLGVPFTTKDCICIEGLHNTAGVVIRKDVIAKKDAVAIHLLREKGAIPIGLSNVPELCMWWETHNHIHGRTNNPYNTTRIVGGSSGGEGCLQGAAGSAFGIGSDIGGSIRMPSYFNGIFGHKPSRYVVSNEGQYPIPSSELQNSFLGVGPMTRHAIDLKPLLTIISGAKSTLLKLDDPVDISKLKIFYQYENGAALVDCVEPEIKDAMRKVLEYLADKTSTEPKEIKINLLEKSVPIWMSTMKDVKPFGKMITGKDSIGVVVMELFKNIIGCSGNTFIGLFTALFDSGGVKIGSERYKHYLNLKEELESIFKNLLGENGVFIYPTHPTAAPYHNEPLFKAMNFSYTAIINCLGLPATNIPLGLNSEGLPLGLQVVANHNNDRLCLALAEELEKAFGGWVEPNFK